jgi:hypothetical protein
LDDVAIGRDDHIGWNPVDPKLPGGLRVIPGIDLDENVIGPQGGGDVIAGEDLLLHSLARGARFGPEVYQDQPVGLRGKPFCRFKARLPADPLLG